MDYTLSYPAAKSNVGPPVLHQGKSAFGSLLVSVFFMVQNTESELIHIQPEFSHINMEIHGENPTVHRRKLAAEASGFPIIGAQGSPRSAIQQRWKSSKLWTRLDRHFQQGFSILRAAWKWWVRWVVACVDTWIKIFQKKDVLEGPGCSKRKVEKNIFCKNDMKNHLSIPPCFWYASARTVLALP